MGKCAQIGMKLSKICRLFIIVVYEYHDCHSLRVGRPYE